VTISKAGQGIDLEEFKKSVRQKIPPLTFSLEDIKRAQIESCHVPYKSKTEQWSKQATAACLQVQMLQITGWSGFQSMSGEAND
jgi:hypothetical protein